MTTDRGANTASRLRERLHVHLRLGRVSNLPTVWSNVLAAMVISGARPGAFGLGTALFACSALYVGGMYLNDACDAEIDARERAERPIPTGLITRSRVYLGAAIWMLVGLFGLIVSRYIIFATLLTDSQGVALVTSLLWVLFPVLLVACIVTYDLYHKGNPYGPVLMAACRALVYLSIGFTMTRVPETTLLYGAVLAFVWIMGLTALAKRESRAANSASSRWDYWPFAVLATPVFVSLLWLQASPLLIGVLCIVLISIVGIAVQLMRSAVPESFGHGIGLLIAGMSIVDALAIARTGASGLAMTACLCCVLTLVFQRRISGT